MHDGITVEELRALARRSRRTAAWGMACLTGALLLFPLSAFATYWMPGWSAAWPYVALVVGGGLMARFAFVAGQERGEFRSAFVRVREQREARRVPVSGASPEVLVSQEEGSPARSAPR